MIAFGEEAERVLAAATNPCRICVRMNLQNDQNYFEKLPLLSLILKRVVCEYPGVVFTLYRMSCQNRLVNCVIEFSETRDWVSIINSYEANIVVFEYKEEEKDSTSAPLLLDLWGLPFLYHLLVCSEWSSYTTKECSYILLTKGRFGMETNQQSNPSSTTWMWIPSRVLTNRSQEFPMMMQCSLPLPVASFRMTNLWVHRTLDRFRESLCRNGKLWTAGIKTMASLYATIRVSPFKASLQRSFLCYFSSLIPIRIWLIPLSPTIPCLAFVIVREEYTKTIRSFRLRDFRRIRISESFLILAPRNNRLFQHRSRRGSPFPWRVTFAQRSSCLKWCRLLKQSTVCVSFT